jgi:RimJ/RimL family protein N-acetyltransferase
MTIKKSIINMINKITRKEVVPTFKIRHANLKDLDKLVMFYDDGAHNGHFKPLEDTRQMFKESIERHVLQILKKGTITTTIVNTFIAEYNNDVVGFLAIGWESGRVDNIELYYCYTDPNYRKLGIMKELIKTVLVIDEFPESTRFYSRCFHVSKIAINTLMKIGFKEYERSNQQVRLEFIK